MFYSMCRHRQLLWSMSKRDVVGRYKGSVLGLAWSFFNPLVMLVVYTFVFNILFKSRWSPNSDDMAEYALALFIGMIVHGIISESIVKAPGLIIGNVNYVKKVVFPLDILPSISMISALFHALISFFVWAIFYLIAYNSFNLTALYLPLIILPLMLMGMGISWFLAALGVYVRDVSQIATILSTVLMFLSPVFYPVANLSKKHQEWISYNPLSFIIETCREILMWGRPPNWFELGKYFVIGLLVAWIGYWFFQKTRKGFADVL